MPIAATKDIAVHGGLCPVRGRRAALPDGSHTVSIKQFLDTGTGIIEHAEEYVIAFSVPEPGDPPAPAEWPSSCSLR